MTRVGYHIRALVARRRARAASASATAASPVDPAGPRDPGAADSAHPWCTACAQMLWKPWRGVGSHELSSMVPDEATDGSTARSPSGKYTEQIPAVSSGERSRIVWVPGM